VHAVEGLVVSAPYWIFKNLALSGEPDTEHAIHVVGAASHVVIRNNFAFNFDAMVKANGLGEGARRQFPDSVLVENNIFLNTALRSGYKPVTPIDVVVGKVWIVRGNFLADFGSANAKTPSYGAFLKGNSQGGLFERNLVGCEWRVSGGAIRIGLSFGGGGTGDSFFRDSDTSIENRSGTMRSNIIMNCRGDIGVYLNKAKDSTIAHNIFYDTYGIDVRFPESSANLAGNIFDSGPRARDGGTMMVRDNLQFGTGVGLRPYQGFVFLGGKLIGAGSKYPSVFWPSVMEWIAGPAGPLTAIDEFVGRSGIGRGRNAADDLFIAPAAFDFGAHGIVETRAGGEGQDFCGRPRSTDRASYGAIEYSTGPCDVTAIVRKADELIKLLADSKR